MIIMKNLEFLPHFPDISDIREKIRDIPNIEIFYEKNAFLKIILLSDSYKLDLPIIQSSMRGLYEMYSH